MAAEDLLLEPDRSPRITPGGRGELGLLNWSISRAAGVVGGTAAPPALFLTLGRHRRLFRAWLRFAGRLMPRGRLPRRETELAILRVAHLRACTYELSHHVELGRRIGVGAADVDRVAIGPDADGWSARERAVLAAVDALHGGDIDDSTWVALRAHLDEVETIELCVLVGHYEMLATVIQALRIRPDDRRRRRYRRAAS